MMDRREKSHNSPSGVQNVIALGRHRKAALFLCGLGALMSLGAGCAGNSALVDIAARNDLVAAQSEIDRGADIHALGTYRAFNSRLYAMTPLHAAAYNGHGAMVELLLEVGADVNAKAVGGVITPLYMACHEGNAKVANTLIDHGAEIDVHSHRGLTALCTAAGRGHAETVQVLLEKGAKADLVSSYRPDTRYRSLRLTTAFTPLYMAASYGHADVVNLLLDHHAQVDKGCHRPALFLSSDYDGDVAPYDVPSATPLHIASLNGRNDVVGILILRGADVGARDDSGETPLHWAARRKRAETMELLVAQGADPQARNRKGKTPSEVIGAPTDAETASGITSLLLASYNLARVVIGAMP